MTQKVRITITKEVDIDSSLLNVLRDSHYNLISEQPDKMSELLADSYTFGYLDAIDLLDEAVWKVEVLNDSTN